MGRLYREWRRLRDQAGELYYMVIQAKKLGRREEAWRVYEEWRSWRISYEEAKKRLEKLLAEATAAARA
ncbi:MAG: hypothetical protein DSY37_00715 [Hyperthermus sp.]|nr:MAG: hypothetical protein DSY37_00715 [Hyperthermus sp.]